MIIFLLFLNLWGQELVIQSNQSSHLNYEKHLLENPNHESFIEFYLSQKNTSHSKLYSLLKTAQFEFLNGSIEKAKFNFKEISELQHQFDWNQNDRKIIHFSFLRYAQLEPNREIKKNILKNSIEFDRQVEIDPDLFPPPLVEEYLELKKEILSNVWQLPKKNSEFSEILINGVKQEKNSSFIKTSSAKKRFTFLSNIYQPIHLTINPSELQNSDLKLIELATGRCENPQLQYQGLKITNFIYFEDHCTKLISNDKKTLELLSHVQHESKTKKGGSFLKNKWFWIGASAIVTGLVYSNISQNQKSQTNNDQQGSTVKTFSNE